LPGRRLFRAIRLRDAHGTAVLQTRGRHRGRHSVWVCGMDTRAQELPRRTGGARWRARRPRRRES
jgi:hypothetical protein